MAVFRTPVDLFESLRAAWSTETSPKWSRDNPARGQCSVTSLVVQDVFGGDILMTRTPGGTHFYNKLDGVRWDLTMSQFDAPIPFEDTPATRSEAFRDTTPLQYAQLRRAIGL